MCTTPTSRTRNRIPVELTRGEVFEVSAHMSSASCSPSQKPVLICPNEVEESEYPEHEMLEESVPAPDVARRAMAVPETPSIKDREGHELTHLPTQAWCSVCVRTKGTDGRDFRRPAGQRAEDEGVDHVPVILFDYAYLSTGDAVSR